MEKKEIKKIETQYHKLQDRLTARVSPLFHCPKAEPIYDQLAGGHNKYLKLNRLENTDYDPRWLDEIEGCIPDIDAIIKNPKKVIENVSEVVPIELARKTNADSVKHLATHSQFVKEIDEKGDVVPNKILNIRSDDFYQTYENRFIATLIRRLVLFVEKRYTIIHENSKVLRTEMLIMKNKSTVDGKSVEIETKVKVCSEAEIDEKQQTFNKNFIKRIEEVRKYLLFFYNSEFMKMLKTEKNVRNPIIMTNIIRKNHIYNHCYRLYKFIEKFDNLGVEFKVDDKFEVLNEAQQAELNNALMTSFLALRGHETVSEEKQKIKRYRPKILTSIDEEAFVYGDYISGSLDFVRVDQAHLDYLDSLIRKDLPEHPTKEEKEFYKEEYEKNKEIKQEKKNIEHLIKQKEKEAIKNQKIFENVIAERQREEEAERARIKREAELSKLHDIEMARRALMGLPEEYQDDTIKELMKNDEEENIIPTQEEPIISENEVQDDESLLNEARDLLIDNQKEEIKEPAEEAIKDEPAEEEVEIIEAVEPIEEEVKEEIPETIKEEEVEPVQVVEPIPEPIEEVVVPAPEVVTPVVKEEVKVQSEPKKPEHHYSIFDAFVKGVSTNGSVGQYQTKPKEEIKEPEVKKVIEKPVEPIIKETPVIIKPAPQPVEKPKEEEKPPVVKPQKTGKKSSIFDAFVNGVEIKQPKESSDKKTDK